MDGKPLSAFTTGDGFQVAMGSRLHDSLQPSCDPGFHQRGSNAAMGEIATPAVAKLSALRLRPGFIDGERSSA